MIYCPHNLLEDRPLLFLGLLCCNIMHAFLSAISLMDIAPGL